MSQVFGANNLQDEKLYKEELRIMRRRQSEEERRQRILNPKNLAMGVDVAALNAQTEESRTKKELENQKKEIERLRALEVAKILERNAEEDRQMKFEQMRKLKNSWESNLMEKKTNEIKYKNDKLILENTSLTGASRFSGDDYEESIERGKNKRQQLKEWLTQQLQEQKYKQSRDQETNDRYNEMQRLLAEIREQDEKEDEEFRRNTNIRIKQENDQLAKERQYYKDMTDPDKIMSIDEKLKATSLDLFNENKTIAVDESKNRVTRVDMFKGFTEAQIKQIMKENDEALQQKRQQQEYEKKLEKDWSAQSAMLHNILENNHEEEERLKKEEAQKRVEFLRQQAQEQVLRNHMRNKDKFGNIDQENGYYSNFGKSCR